MTPWYPKSHMLCTVTKELLLGSFIKRKLQLTFKLCPYSVCLKFLLQKCYLASFWTKGSLSTGSKLKYSVWTHFASNTQIKQYSKMQYSFTFWFTIVWILAPVLASCSEELEFLSVHPILAKSVPKWFSLYVILVLRKLVMVFKWPAYQS